MSKRGEFFQQCNAETEHQHQAGCASWSAFSARWRARQGLPLLYARDVKYLTPADFCNGLGHPLHPTEQRRLFQQYVQTWAQQELLSSASSPQTLSPRRPMASTTVPDFVRSPYSSERRDVIYGGRDDVQPWEQEALLPTRPYVVPVAQSEEGELIWLEGVEGVDEDEM